MTRRQLLRRALLVGGGLGASGFSYAYLWEPWHISVTRVTLRLPRWTPQDPPLRIGQLSDLHCDSERATERAREAVRILMSEKPDIVFLTGDYVTLGGGRWVSEAVDALAPVTRAPLGAFATLGNHDYWAGRPEAIKAGLKNVGVHVLCNEHARVKGRDGLWILGVDSIATGAADATVAAKGVPKEATRIMLVHEPDFADYAFIEVALQVSGHSHGGQIRFPGLPAYTPAGARRYHMGYYPHAPNPLFVSRGIGTVGLPLRFRCPPEVVVLMLRGPVFPRGTEGQGPA